VQYVTGHAKVRESARILGPARIDGKSVVEGNAFISGGHITGRAVIGGRAVVRPGDIVDGSRPDASDTPAATGNGRGPAGPVDDSPARLHDTA